MKLILTHEQADLDALASMLGAHLLDASAIALLPRNINRNASDFISQYQADLIFTSSHNLPHEPITQITLVDTQSLVTLKGFTSETTIKVIDHHPRKEGVDDDWEVEISHTGACTTLLVEKIKEQGILLRSIQASMLLLGIYEDTGSLSYSTTTSRDLCAAAFLLEQGADLAVVSDHLNPPLTSTQQLLYDRIMKNLETLTIENQTIITAKADATDVNEEISTVAHKLRDFLDPDALLLLVLTKQGIRLVARATTDAVNVSKVAATFGGGGHTRAASALIRAEGKLSTIEYEMLLDETYQTMKNLLPKHVRPLLYVRHIMSKNPMILTPDTPVDEVARLMQRYGFEGYPVVENGVIVGLLNRRAVDRAQNHKLSMPASSLMEAGNISVRPDDSLETLTKLMATTGWGQIPVVDSQSGEIIGIVTRTDLIKTGSVSGIQPTQSSIISLLKKAVPPSRLILLNKIAAEADRANIPIYIVGGFVRDLLLNRSSSDFDIVIEGDAIYFAKILVKVFGGRAVFHSRFGTAKWYLADDKQKIASKISTDIPIIMDDLPDHLDMITARTEFYDHPAALPTVESSSIKMDLHRRDFTINTLALRLDGEHYGKIFDYWGGLIDLENGKIRVLHTLSFVDDATRLLRAVRFEQRFDFTIEERTLALMTESLPLLNETSGIRLLHELELILAEPKVIQMFNRLDQLNILKAIHPDIPWSQERADSFKTLDSLDIPSKWELNEHCEDSTLRQTLGMIFWLINTPERTLTEITSRLRINAKIVSAIKKAGNLYQELVNLVKATPSQIYNRLVSYPRLVLYAVYLIAPTQEQKDRLETFVDKYAKVEPFTNGNDLKALGLEASPKYSEILKSLRDGWLDGTITSIQEEKERLLSLLPKNE